MTEDRISPPRYEDLPPPRQVSRDPSLRVVLQTTTPIFGGGVEARKLDMEDVIRVPTIRGHLRWWWRALFAERFTASELFEAEARRWGGVVKETVHRSTVSVKVSVRDKGRDRGARWMPDADVGYVTWPATMPDEASLRHPTVCFELDINVSEPRSKDVDRAGLVDEVRDCIVAWILFGGYGGRVRRGMGSLTVVERRSEWLPSSPTPHEIARCFRRGRPLQGATTTRCSQEISRLAGAELYTNHRTTPDALKAWSNAVAWLHEFRQGVESGARQQGRDPQKGRPSISNWPEADQVRHLSRRKNLKPHKPRHDQRANWPRSAFGLPIMGRFQTKDRQGRKTYDEPDNFRITWKDPTGVRDRLASPLILKALPLANGDFAPVALWLDRASPHGGKVVMTFGQHGPECPSSAVDFDAPPIAPGDSCFFPPLEGHSTMRDAFFAWLSVNGPKIRGGSSKKSHGNKRSRHRGRNGGRR